MDIVAIVTSLLAVFLTVIQPAAPDAGLEAFHRAPRVRRVIGGTKIEEGQWPWLSHLRGKVPTRMFWGIPLAHANMYCGGTVLDKRWILTAAHCFDGQSRALTAKYWHIKVGEIDSTHSVGDRAKSFFGRIFGREDWRLWYIHGSKIIRHPQYRPDNLWTNDIALIKLKEDLPLTTDPNIGAVTLPTAGDSAWPEEGSSCIMKGWGCTANGGPVQEFARAVRLPVINNDTCARTYGRRSFDGRLCAGARLHDIGICKGDSGGPLVCMKDNKGWTMAGVASFTSANRPGEYPGVFTRVSTHMKWIRNVMANN